MTMLNEKSSKASTVINVSINEFECAIFILKYVLYAQHTDMWSLLSVEMVQYMIL